MSWVYYDLSPFLYFQIYIIAISRQSLPQQLYLLQLFRYVYALRRTNPMYILWVILNMPVCSPHLGTQQANDLAKDGAFIAVTALKDVCPARRYGNTFCISGPLWGNPSVTGGCPSLRTNCSELWCVLCCWSEQAVIGYLRHPDAHVTSLLWMSLSSRSSWFDETRMCNSLSRKTRTWLTMVGTQTCRLCWTQDQNQYICLYFHHFWWAYTKFETKNENEGLTNTIHEYIH